MTPDHDKYLERAKKEARVYLKEGDGASAVASICMDLSKHPDWEARRLVSTMALLYATDPTLENASRIVEGFR